MLRGGHLSDRTPPSWPVRYRTSPTRLSRYMSPLFLFQKYLPICSFVACFSAPCVRLPAPLCIAVAAIPHCAAPLLLAAVGSSAAPHSALACRGHVVHHATRRISSLAGTTSLIVRKLRKP
jgi:hypothetical protein